MNGAIAGTAEAGEMSHVQKQERDNPNFNPKKTHVEEMAIGPHHPIAIVLIYCFCSQVSTLYSGACFMCCLRLTRDVEVEH